MNSDKLTILISSPESYRDVFNIAADFYAKNWPNCPYQKTYATDFLNMNFYKKKEEQSEYKGFNVLLLPEYKEFVSRTVNALKNIKTKYVMLICDDMFLVKKIKNDDFIKLIDFIEEKDFVYCRLNKSKNIARSKNMIYDNVYQIKYNHPYGRNLQAAIWETDFLKFILSDSSFSALELEENWSKQSLSEKDKIIEKHCYYHNDYFYHAVYKGKWLRGVEKIVKKNKIQYKTNRSKISLKTSFIILIKVVMRNIFSSEARFKIKKYFSKHFDIDSRY